MCITQNIKKNSDRNLTCYQISAPTKLQRIAPYYNYNLESEFNKIGKRNRVHYRKDSQSRRSGVLWSRRSGVLWSRRSGVLWSRRSGVLWSRRSGVLWSRRSGVLWSRQGLESPGFGVTGCVACHRFNKDVRKMDEFH